MSDPTLGFESRYKRGLITISADPVTFGHLHLIDKALAEAATLVVCLLENPAKLGGYVLPTEDRLRLTERAVRDFCKAPDRVKVIRDEGLLVDVFLREDCDVIFRGVRNDKDTEFELDQVYYHNLILPGVAGKFVFLQSDCPRINSTAVRSLAAHHADVTAMAPLAVQARLWRVMHSQKFIALTGAPGIGKTDIGKTIVENLREVSLPAHLIDIRTMTLGLDDEQSPAGEKWRGLMADLEEEKTTSASVMAYLGGHPERFFRQALHGLKGIIILEGMMMGNQGLTHWTNNNAIVVRDDDHSGCYDEETEDEIAAWKAAQAKDKYGSLLEFTPGPGKLVESVSSQVVKLIRDGEM